MVIAVHRSQWNKVLKSFEHVQKIPPICAMNSDKCEGAIVRYPSFAVEFCEILWNSVESYVILWNSVEFCGKLWKSLIISLIIQYKMRSSLPVAPPCATIVLVITMMPDHRLF